MKGLVQGGIISAADELGKLTSKQSQFIKIWYISVAFRIMIIYSVGQQIYSKEESSFKCATKQFLCRTVCYDQFMPMNPTRFWIWQTHCLVLIVVLFNWLQSPKLRLFNENSSTRQDKWIERKMICLALVQSFILMVIELGFGFLFLLLLAKQHSPSMPFKQLLHTGDLFFSPSVYTCDIQKTFSENERQMYFKRENVAFRKTPAGLRVKAQLACEQSDALCTVDRSSEKSLITLSISLFICLGIIALFFDVLSCLTKLLLSCRNKNKSK